MQGFSNNLIANASNLVNGFALDVGCGNGNDLVFLAKKGFSVDGIDISKRSIHDSSQLLKINKLGFEKINLINADIVSYELEKNYNLIICNYVLHFLDEKDVFKVIEKIKKHTAKEGINVLSVFTEESDADYPKYKFKKGELKDKYGGWEILQYNETDGFGEIIARK